jgi:hypothetical protein
MAFNPGGSSGIATATDVALSSVANNDVLTYSAGTAKWKNQPAAAGGVVSYASLPAGTTIGVDYDSGTSSYPNRPTPRTDIIVRWRGPSAPTIGGNGALDNVDEWVNTGA